MVDLLACALLLEQAVEFLEKFSKTADNVFWADFLAVSQIYRSIKYAKFSLRILIVLDQKTLQLCHGLLSNKFGEAWKWKDLARVKVATGDVRSKKLLGCSSIVTLTMGFVELYSYDENEGSKLRFNEFKIIGVHHFLSSFEKQLQILKLQDQPTLSRLQIPKPTTSL